MVSARAFPLHPSPYSSRGPFSKHEPVEFPSAQDPREHPLIQSKSQALPRAPCPSHSSSIADTWLGLPGLLVLPQTWRSLSAAGLECFPQMSQHPFPQTFAQALSVIRSERPSCHTI